MTRQKDAFLLSEGDAYNRRNKKKDPFRHDGNLLMRAWTRLPFQPKRLLEIGCSSGYNLALLRKHYKVECYGVDPSREAIEEGNARGDPELQLQVGVASSLPYTDGFFDAVYFGGCLSMCDRDDLFKIAYEADRVLQPHGVMLIMDFEPPFPYRNPYKHYPGLYMCKMRYSDMFTWNPCYSVMEKYALSIAGDGFALDPNERFACNVLYKSEALSCYPISPFSC